MAHRTTARFGGGVGGGGAASDKWLALEIDGSQLGQDVRQLRPQLHLCGKQVGKCAPELITLRTHGRHLRAYRG